MLPYFPQLPPPVPVGLSLLVTGLASGLITGLTPVAGSAKWGYGVFGDNRGVRGVQTVRDNNKTGHNNSTHPSKLPNHQGLLAENHRRYNQRY